jgi:hypothetical protein
MGDEQYSCAYIFCYIFVSAMLVYVAEMLLCLKCASMHEMLINLCLE